MALYNGVDARVAAVGQGISPETVVAIVILHQPFGAAHPQSALLVYQKAGDDIVGDGGRVIVMMQIVYKVIAVKSAQTIVCSHPYKAVFVLRDAVDKAAGQHA